MLGKEGYFTLDILGGAMAKLSQTLQQLDQRRTPLRVTSVVRQSIKTMADTLPFPSNLVLRQLLSPLLSSGVLRILGTRGEVFGPILRNKVNATTIYVITRKNRS